MVTMADDATPIDIVPVDYDDPEVLPLIERQIEDLARRQGIAPWSVGTPSDYKFPRGIFLVARIGGEPAGCGGLRTSYAAHVGEVKRMWTEQDFRRRGVATAILNHLEGLWAPELGFQDLILSVHDVAPEAISLYEARGWRAAPGDPRYGFWARSLVYTKPVSL